MSGLLDYLGSALLHGTAVALLALGVERALRPWLTPSAGALLWTVALLKFLLPWGPALPFSLSSGLDSARQALALEPLPVAAAATGEMPGPWLGLALGAYLAAVAALLLGRALAFAYLARAVAALPRAPGLVQARVAAVATRLGLKRAPPTRLGAGPLVLGWWRPTLVLPAAVAEGADLEPVLLHELTHLRRGDAWVRLLQAVAEALFFFWPPVAGVSRRLEHWRELACDEAALDGAGLPAPAYVRLLLRARQAAAPAPAGLSMASPASRLERRVVALLALRPGRRVRGTGLALAAWAALALGGSALASDAGASAAPTGTLEEGTIRAVMQEALGTISGCYEHALLVEPSLEGKLALRWLVAPDGAVQGAAVARADYRGHRSAAANAQLEACVVKAVAALHFPRPTGGAVEVEYPFLFSSSSR